MMTAENGKAGKAGAAGEAGEAGKVAQIQSIPWNGTFTIRNTTTGDYRTFQIRTQPDDAKWAPGKRVLSLLTGPDNTYNYKAFAFIYPNDIAVFKKHRSERGDAKTMYEQLAAMVVFVVAPRMMISGRGCCFGGVFVRENYDLQFSRKCRVCNRKLTTPESIESGIGPVCAGRA